MSDQPTRSLFGESEFANQEQEKPMGMMDIISGIFSDPVELFRRLSKKPQWAGAMVLGAVAIVVFMVAWSLRVDALEFVFAQIERAMPNSPRLQQLTSDQLEQSATIQARLTPFIYPVSGMINSVIFSFFFGLLYWAVSLFSKEDLQWKPTYKHGLVVACVPDLITVPYCFLGTIMAFLNPVGTFMHTQIVPSSLAYWLETDSPRLLTLYGLVDLFLLAQYVMIFFAAKYTLRTKTWGATICVALALLIPGLSVWMAK